MGIGHFHFQRGQEVIDWRFTDWSPLQSSHQEPIDCPERQNIALWHFLRKEYKKTLQTQLNHVIWVLDNIFMLFDVMFVCYFSSFHKVAAGCFDVKLDVDYSSNPILNLLPSIQTNRHFISSPFSRVSIRQLLSCLSWTITLLKLDPFTSEICWKRWILEDKKSQPYVCLLTLMFRLFVFFNGQWWF